VIDADCSRYRAIPVLIDKTLELCGHRSAAKEIQVRRQQRPSLPLGTADSEQLKQVFVNSVDNATEATPRGGQIRIPAEAATFTIAAESISTPATSAPSHPGHAGTTRPPETEKSP
jgi:signal transduction histidine kinase